MPTLIVQNESVPDHYPDDPLTSDSPADYSAVWQRIENYTSYRWTERAVVWVVEGPGEWRPPLAPAVIDTIQVWDAGEYVETFDVGPSPYGGLFFPICGPYRIEATVGANVEVPPAVLEAAKRYAAYLTAADPNEAGIRQTSVSLGEISNSTSRHEAYAARGLVNSGAADLLRSYRRA